MVLEESTAATKEWCWKCTRVDYTRYKKGIEGKWLKN